MASGSRRLSTREALAVPSRRELLDLLRQRGGMDAAQLAAELGLHISTVRFHLDVLGGAGLVRSSPAPAQGPGRPRLVFRPAAPAAEDSTGYRMLAEILAAHLDEDEDEGSGSRRAQAAGHAWARRHRGEDPEPAARTLAGAVQRVHEHFAEWGFAPEHSASDGHHRIEMRSCPYRSLAERHPEVTCGLHRGLLDELLESLLASGPEPVPAAELVPFASPDYCLVRVSARSG